MCNVGALWATTCASDVKDYYAARCRNKRSCTGAVVGTQLGGALKMVDVCESGYLTGEYLCVSD